MALRDCSQFEACSAHAETLKTALAAAQAGNQHCGRFSSSGSLAMLAIRRASSPAFAASFAQQKIFQDKLSIAGSKRPAANQAG